MCISFRQPAIVVFIAFLLILQCVVSAAAAVDPVRAGVDPFDVEKKAMQMLAQQDSAANRHTLARVRYKCALDLYGYFHKQKDTSALELAAAYAASAVELDNSKIAHWTVLGQLLANLADKGYLGSRQLAIEALGEAVRMAPDDRAGQIILSLNLMLAGQYRNALDHLEPAIAAQPDKIDPKLVLAAGICYIRGPLTRRGVGFFDRLLAKRPDLTYVRLSKAVLLEHQNRREEALRELNAIHADPSADAADRQYALDLKALWHQYGTIGELD